MGGITMCWSGLLLFMLVASPMSLWLLWWPPTGSSMFMVVVMLLIYSVLHCLYSVGNKIITHYDDVIMSAIASQITSLMIVYSIVYSDADQGNHQSSASLAFVWGIHRGPVNSPHEWPVTRKMFPFDDVIMYYYLCPGVTAKHSFIKKMSLMNLKTLRI